MFVVGVAMAGIASGFILGWICCTEVEVKPLARRHHLLQLRRRRALERLPLPPPGDEAA